MDCRKCYSTLYECQDCDGQTRRSLLGDTLTCRTCNSTGSLCPTHDGYWE